MTNEAGSNDGPSVVERLYALEMIVKVLLAISGADVASLEASLQGCADALETEDSSELNESVKRVHAHALAILRDVRDTQAGGPAAAATQDREGERVAAERAEIDKEF